MKIKKYTPLKLFQFINFHEHPTLTLYNPWLYEARFIILLKESHAKQNKNSQIECCRSCQIRCWKSRNFISW